MEIRFAPRIVAAGMFGRRTRRRIRVLGAAVAAWLGTASCSWLPNEFNVSPIYRQRLAEDGTVLEVDVLWPIFHYELTPEGGDDFRIRPFYRRITEPDQREFVALPAVEHQFLWPLGRVRTDDEQSMSRLFPLWWHRSRTDDLGLEETDWYALFPFLWGGSREDGKEWYFGFFPFYADLPDFLAYERLLFVMWPLYTRTERWGRVGEILLWPFIGGGRGPDGYDWHRFLPLWSWVDNPKRRYRSVLFPFIQWGTDNLHTDDPVHRWWLWPLIGQQWNTKVTAWSFLWPLFQYIAIEGRRLKLDIVWPIFRFEEDTNFFKPIYQWWLWPLIAHTVTDRQDAWVYLWPLIWKRRYWNPEDDVRQNFVVPFFWQTEREGDDGSHGGFAKLWPIMHASTSTDPQGGRTGEWSLLSPWPWNHGNAYGIEESYGWLWTIAKGRRRTPTDDSIEFAANLYTERVREDVTQASMPFLFNYEGDSEGGTLRLLQFIPIPWWGTDQTPQDGDR